MAGVPGTSLCLTEASTYLQERRKSGSLERWEASVSRGWEHGGETQMGSDGNGLLARC